MKTVSYIIRGVDGDRHYVNGELVKPTKPSEKVATEETSSDVADEREELKEKLKEAGVQFGGNTSTAKLREMVAKL